MKLTMTTLVTLVLLASGTVYAATQPSAPGPTSAGTIDVSVDVGDVVQITGIKELAPIEWDGRAIGYTNSALEQNLCIYSNTMTHQYNITFTDTNNKPTFGLVGQMHKNTVPFTMLFIDNTSSSFSIENTNQQVANRVGSESPTCEAEGGSNATLKIAVSSASSTAAVADTYADTINLIVTPV